MTAEDERLIVSEYIAGKSARQILDILGNKFKTKKTVYDILKKYDITTRTLIDYQEIDHFYFSSIDKPIKAYILGWLISDGWVASKGTKNQVAIQLQEGDKYILEMIKKEFKTDNKIFKCKKKPFKSLVNDNIYHSQTMYRLDVRSPRMIEDLARFGIVPCKSLITILPVLEDYQSHLLRGILDGDGSIYLHAQANTPCVRFLGSHYIVAQIILYLHITLGVSYRFPIHRENISIVDWSAKNDVKTILDYLYKDSEHIRLERKYEKIKSYIC